MPGFERIADGHEKTFQVNHLAPFLLTNLLMDVLAAGSATVITTASDAVSLGHVDLDDLDSTRGFDTKKAYATSKLENILFTRELHRRYAGRGIHAVAFQPGNVASNFASGTTSNWRFVYNTPLRHIALVSPEKGTRTLLWLVNGTPGTTWTPGLFYARNKPKIPTPRPGMMLSRRACGTAAPSWPGSPTPPENPAFRKARACPAALGATHLAVDTMGTGLSTVGDHLAALRETIDALRAYAT